MGIGDPAMDISEAPTAFAEPPLRFGSISPSATIARSELKRLMRQALSR